MNPVKPSTKLTEVEGKVDERATKTILLLGNRRQSLTVIRSLAAQGWKIIAAVNRGDDRNYHSHRSRFVSETWVHDDYHMNLNLFVTQLVNRLTTGEPIRAIFPVDEAAIRCIEKIRKQLPSPVVPVMANSQAIKTCLDKPSMFSVCEAMGVPVRQYHIAQSEAEVRQFATQLGYPLIIKPLDEETIAFGIKAEIVRDENQLEGLDSKIGLENRRLMVQEYATGPRHNVYFAAAEGKLVAAAEVKIARTDRQDGTGLAVSGRTVPPTKSLWQDTEALCSALNYHGVGCARFLVDADQNTRMFLELNPRLGANFAAVDHAGLHLARLAVEIALGDELPDSSKVSDYRVGQSFAWTMVILQVAGLNSDKADFLLRSFCQGFSIA